MLRLRFRLAESSGLVGAPLEAAPTLWAYGTWPGQARFARPVALFTVRQTTSVEEDMPVPMGGAAFIEGDYLRLALIANTMFSAVDDIDKRESSYAIRHLESGEGCVPIHLLLGTTTPVRVDMISDMIYRKTDLALKMRAVKDDPAKRMQVLTAPETLMSQTMLGDIMDKTYKVARKASIDISVVRYDAPAGIGLRAPRPLIWGTETFMKAAQHVMTRVESLYIKHATGMDMGNRTRASLSLSLPPA